MITLVNDQGGDWVAVYRDGKLLAQGHSFQENHLLEILGIEHETIWDADAAPTGYQFPKALEEVARNEALA